MTDEQSAASLPHGASSGHDHLSHVASVRVLLTVFVLLIVLTIATVSASSLGARQWEIWITLGIATIKGGLVVAFFMHLIYDKPLNAFIFAVALAFATLFLAITLMDLSQPDLHITPTSGLEEPVP